jgi:hypothetical protein
MVVWYGPTALYTTGMRHLISGIFGQYADQRTLQWATDQVSDEDLAGRYDYSRPEKQEDGVAAPENPVWVDYLADTGDGFDSSYAIASLVAASQLEVEGAGTLEGGKLLIMGGDQVYPFASPEQYEKHLIQPFSLADCDTTEPDRKLFVLPGNHDWYDGLSAFDQIFCQARDGVSEGLKMGRWHCPQHRSYFAIKLPHDWWIWGLDTQLTRNLDVGQVRYFRVIADSIKDKTKAKIILCIPQPVWHEAAATGSKRSYPSNINRIVPLAFDEARVCAIIAGDYHHYSRYRGVENGLNLITAGGGGAYLSPTHHLKDSIPVPWGGETHEFSLRQEAHGKPDEKSKWSAPSLFPSRADSKALSWRLLLFPIYNRAYSIGLGVIYWLITWFYSTAQVVRKNFETGFTGQHYVGNILSRPEQYNLSGFTEHVLLIADAVRGSPSVAFLGVLFLAVLYVYVKSSRMWAKITASVIHWGVHIAMMVQLTILLSQFNLWLQSIFEPQFRLTPAQWDTIVGVGFFPLEMILLGGIFGGVIWGIYLFLNCRLFYLHLDDAFSALRITGYKHFLRMRVEPDRLTIYPIGLKAVPTRMGWRKRTDEEKAKGIRTAFVPRFALKPRLIEEPIVIRPSDVRDF